MGAGIFREIWANWTIFRISGLVQNLIGEHTIFGAVFQKGQHVSYYGVSHWSVARDEGGEIGPENVGIIHVF